jgi:Flp pilus assembly protein TadB
VLASAVVLTLGGVLGRDRWLTREVARREERMLEEFPTVAELLALAVTAGEGPVGALERVHRISAGELSKELGRRSPRPAPAPRWSQALEGVAARTSLAPLARFVDGVAIAVERGTPLAEVLRAQAVDVREAGKRRLLESAGRREIAMMVPVVFLVLPVTVVFALFPGFYACPWSRRDRVTRSPGRSRSGLRRSHATTPCGGLDVTTPVADRLVVRAQTGSLEPIPSEATYPAG